MTDLPPVVGWSPARLFLVRDLLVTGSAGLGECRNLCRRPSRRYKAV